MRGQVRSQIEFGNEETGLRTLAGGEDLRLFLLWLFDFFLLTVVAFTHDKLPVWLVAMRVAMRLESATTFPNDTRGRGA